MSKIFLSLFVGIALFFISSFVNSALASSDGVFMSSTAVGSTVRLIGNIPPHPCTAHGLGSSQEVTNQVTGFMIESFYLNANNTMMNDPVLADLSGGNVTSFTVSGRQIGFHPWSSGATNASDWLKTVREYEFDSPVTYNPIDTAQVIMENVKLQQPGRLELSIGLTHNHGLTSCYSTQSVYTLGITSGPAKSSSYDNVFAPSITPVHTLQKRLGSPSPTVVPSQLPAATAVITRAPTETVIHTPPLQPAHQSFLTTLFLNLSKLLHFYDRKNK